MDGNQLEKLLDALTTSQKERVRVALASLEEGLLTSSEFVDVVASIVLAGNARAYSIGAALARSLIENQTGLVETTPASTAGHALDTERVRSGLTTILATDKDTLMQLQRLAGNEVQQAATDGSSDVLATSGRATGWVRELDADACQLCRWWWRDGRVWRTNHPMPRHPGCGCQQTPVVDVATDNRQEGANA